MDYPREKDFVLKRSSVLKPGTPWPTFAAHFFSFAGKHKKVLLELTKVDQEETERVKKALRREIKQGSNRAKGVLKRMKEIEKKRADSDDKITAALLQSTMDNRAAEMIVMNAMNQKATPDVTWRELRLRFNDSSEANLSSTITAWNQLKASHGEKRLTFIERIDEFMIILHDMNHIIPEATRITTLLNGLREVSPEHAQQVISLELLPMSWTDIVSRMRVWDRLDDNRAASTQVANLACKNCHHQHHKNPQYCYESANVAHTNSTCFTCGEIGHISPNCPNNADGKDFPSKGKRREFDKSQKRKGRPTSEHGDVECFLCKKKGHFLSDCRHLKAAQELMAKEGLLKGKRNHEKKIKKETTEESEDSNFGSGNLVMESQIDDDGDFIPALISSSEDDDFIPSLRSGPKSSSSWQNMNPMTQTWTWPPTT